MVEDVFHPQREVEIGHLRAKVIGHASAPQHIAGNAAGAAIGALGNGIGVIGKLARLEVAVEVKSPAAGLVIDTKGAFVLRREGNLVTVGVAFLADFSIDVRIAGVDREIIKRG